MKDEISGMDLVALVQELKVLEGARIDKFYQRDNELILHVYKPGDQKYRVFMTAGRIFLTDYKREMPDKPPGFCMFLRKQLGGQEIQRVEQYDFDRIVEFHFDDAVLICELFRQGNFILTNKNQEIQAAMTSGDTSGGREVYVGEQYEYPEPTAKPGEHTVGWLNEFPEDDVVAVLAAKAGIGGAYAEEVCARADVAKNTPVEKLTAAEKERTIKTLHKVWNTLDTGTMKPQVYYDPNPDDEYADEQIPVAATPFPFVTYDEYDPEEYGSFSRALDTYFTEQEKVQYRREQTKEYRERKEKLERRLEQQQQKLQGLEASIDEHQDTGDIIYRHYSLVEDIIDSIRGAREQYSASEIRDRLESEAAEGVPEAEAIEQLDLGNDSVIVDLGGENVTIDVTQDVEANAERYYEKSKQAKQKIEGVKQAIKETEREMAEVEELNPENVDTADAFENKEQKQAEKQWYEKFRWFFSSDGFLVIGGRDTTTNDMLVKKYLEDPDIYVHAEFTGAPSVAIKTEGEEVPESTLEEAGQFAVTFARSWDAGVTAEDAYWVHPDQVTQEPESGEYLPKGSFVIRGDRNYMKNLPVEAAVGAYERGDGTVVAMGGPPSAIEAQCDHYVVIKQGRDKPSDVAKTIQSHLHERTGEDFDLDRIIRSLPPGNACVKEKY